MSQHSAQKRSAQKKSRHISKGDGYFITKKNHKYTWVANCPFDASRSKSRDRHITRLL
jgi:hypothetical protein